VFALFSALWTEPERLLPLNLDSLRIDFGALPASSELVVLLTSDWQFLADACEEILFGRDFQASNSRVQSAGDE
jgi:hypothetical protein